MSLKFLNKLFVLCAFLFCFAHTVHAGPGAGIVIGLSGQAWADGQEGRRSLALQSSVFEQDHLVTDTDGRIQILFADDSILSLGPSTSVHISKFAFDKTKSPTMAVHLAKGLTRIVSGKVVEQNPAGFKCTSPLATIGIRGTVTVHDVAEDHEQHFAEHIGSGHTVWIKGPDGVTVELRKSLTGIDLQLGKPTPQQPRPMTSTEQNISSSRTSPDLQKTPTLLANQPGIQSISQNYWKTGTQQNAGDFTLTALNDVASESSMSMNHLDGLGGKYDDTRDDIEDLGDAIETLNEYFSRYEKAWTDTLDLKIGLDGKRGELEGLFLTHSHNYDLASDAGAGPTGDALNDFSDIRMAYGAFMNVYNAFSNYRDSNMPITLVNGKAYVETSENFYDDAEDKAEDAEELFEEKIEDIRD